MHAQVLSAALKQKALVLSIKGELYAASMFEHVGWWIWKLEVSAPEYFVSDNFTKCTCPVGRKCKHIDALLAGVPHPPKTRSDKRHTRG